MAEVVKTILDVIFIVFFLLMAIVFGVGAFLVASIPCIEPEDDDIEDVDKNG